MADLCRAVHSLHGHQFGLSGHELDVIHDCGMAFVKMLVLVLFFFSWVALKWGVPTVEKA